MLGNYVTARSNEVSANTASADEWEAIIAQARDWGFTKDEIRTFLASDLHRSTLEG